MDIVDKNYRIMDDESLMAFVQSGDGQAFEELFHRYQQRMTGYFFRMLGGDIDKAQDFVQDLFVKVIDYRANYRRQAKFSTWLYTIAGNLCKNEYRRQHVRRGESTGIDPDQMANAGSSESDLHEAIAIQQLQKHINSALEQMDEAQRSAFVVRFQEDMSIREISEIMDCAEGTTKSRLFYVTRKLAALLRGMG